MEKTSHTPAPSPAGLNTLRQNIHIRLIAQAEALLQELEDMEAPQTAQQVERHAKAALAVSKLFDKLIPALLEEENAAPAPEGQSAAATPAVMNRHQRRKMQAKARKGTSPAAPVPGHASARV